MTQNTDPPRIYVACLASYNAGRLHGEWIDATQDVEEIREKIQAMLEQSPEPGAEEYAIHDFENFEPLEFHEYESLEHVARAAVLILAHRDLAALVIDYYGGLDHLDEAEEALTQHLVGSFDDREDWAHQLLDDTGALGKVPEKLRHYIDMKRYARDLELSGDLIVLEGKVEGGGQKVFILWNR